MARIAPRPEAATEQLTEYLRDGLPPAASWWLDEMVAGRLQPIDARVYAATRDFVARWRRSPSLAEIAAAVGLATHSAVRPMVQRLITAGLLERQPSRQGGPNGSLTVCGMSGTAVPPAPPAAKPYCTPDPVDEEDDDAPRALPLSQAQCCATCRHVVRDARYPCARNRHPRAGRWPALVCNQHEYALPKA